MFGSWARDEANSDSDLDLLVLTLSPISKPLSELFSG
ncbi:MAG: hypothetical protein BRC43_10245 [Cyanobacteria bacterium QS_3_48_167]|nr:MAG: hypothetical protein BRC43_10245 [Cyanobacteria bacterium QS_3_48_167]